MNASPHRCGHSTGRRTAGGAWLLVGEFILPPLAARMATSFQLHGYLSI